MIRFTRNAERERVQKAEEHRAKWEYFSTPSLAEAAHFAKKRGWEENKVQVRSTPLGNGEFEYSIEPHEECSCPNILRYDDYFIRKDEDIVRDKE